MRIGFLGPFGSMYNADYGSERQVGAIEFQIFGLAKELLSRGHEVFVTRNWKGKDKQNIIQGVHLVNVNLFSSIEQGFYYSKFPLNRLSYVYYLAKAPEQLRRLNLDVMNASEVLPGWLALKSIQTQKSRSVFITHNNDIYVQSSSKHSPKSYFAENMLHAINKRYDATIAVTKGVEEYFRTFGLSCHAIIPEALDPAEYTSRDDDGFILTGGRLVKHKRIEDLLKVYSEIKDHTENDLVILGDGVQKSFLMRTVASLNIKDRTRFIPFLPKAKYRELLSQCSLFVLPSEAEVFGVAVLEAMACEKPVIARNIVGPRDIINNGYNGLLFQNNKELKEYLTLLLSDSSLRRKIGSNARKTVEQKYTFKRIAESYEKLYESLVYS